MTDLHRQLNKYITKRGNSSPLFHRKLKNFVKRQVLNRELVSEFRKAVPFKALSASLGSILVLILYIALE